MQNGRVKAGAIGDRPAGGGPRAALSLIWDFWKAYAEKIAFYQTTVILTVIYAVVVGPISLIGRLERPSVPAASARTMPAASGTPPTWAASAASTS